MTTRRVSVTPPATLLGGWAPPTTRRVSVTLPGPQGSDTMTTRRVSVTPPATLLGGWAPPVTRRVSVTQPGPQGPRHRDNSARLRDSASDPARGLGAIYDLVRLCDSAKASGPRRLDYLESLNDLTQGFRVRVTKSGLITVATSRWLNSDNLRGVVRRRYRLDVQASGWTS